MYRARLGVGQSKETKKAPGFVFRPGVGQIQIACCYNPKRPVPPNVIEPILPIKIAFNTSNNALQFSFIGIPIVYVLPTIPPGFLWSVLATTTGGNGNTTSATKTYPGGTSLYIYVGTPGAVFAIPGPFPIVLITPGGASGVFEGLDLFNFPTGPLSTSYGDNNINDPSVILNLTIINPIFNGGTPSLSPPNILDGGGVSPGIYVPVYDGGIP